jgi:L-alanine-DL-glutamate epimerase-like enolase superfamily enzyme
MGELDFMMRQIQEKIGQGFQCIKLKVGSLDFEQECDVIRSIREQYSPEDITIRLDANGAFQPDEAMFKLERLSDYHIHSIEQPIQVGQPELERLCQHSPIPIALDEELIHCESTHSKRELLNRIRPSYIVLKPTLHGGFSGCQEWIELAENQGIGWWITSALESNIGLNAICQFTTNYRNPLPQGLGTGAIYQNNIESPLCVANGHIFLDNSKTWDMAFLSS